MNGTAPTVIPNNVPPPTKARKDLVRSVYRSSNGAGARRRWRTAAQMSAAETSPHMTVGTHPELGSDTMWAV